MMEPSWLTKFQSPLLGRITDIPHISQLVLFSACCERLLPDYEAFSAIASWGDWRMLRNTLDDIWMRLENRTINEYDPRQISQICQMIKAVVPDTDRFQITYTGLAQNACSALYYTLCAITDNNVRIAGRILNAPLNSLYMYLATVNDSEIDIHVDDENLLDWLTTCPLVVKEHSIQTTDFLALQSDNGVTISTIKRCRQKSESSGIQPIKRGLVVLINGQSESQ